MRSARLAIPLLLGLILAGCGSGSAGGQAQSAQPAKTTTVNLPPSYRFDPVAIQVSAGSTVTWTNNDNFSHSVLLLGGANDVHSMKPGEKATITFDKPGTYDYVCTYHTQNMKGRVVVTS
jgi:plastocyanin